MIFLITIDELKRNGLIHDNVDTKLLNVTLKRTQDIELQSVLGTPLYKELLRRKDADDWNADYLKLLNDYVTPCLVAFTDMRSSIFLNDKITNKNVGKGTDSERTANTTPNTNYLLNKISDDAEHYRNVLLGFLKDNCEIYTEYKINNCNYEDVEKQRHKKGALKGWIV